MTKAEPIAKGCEHQRKLQVPPGLKHKPDILKGMRFKSVVEVSDLDVRSNPDDEPEMSEIRPPTTLPGRLAPPSSSSRQDQRQNMVRRC